MKYVFYRIEPYESDVKKVLDAYFEEAGIYREYNSVHREEDILCERGQDCTIFYLITPGGQNQMLRKLIQQHGIKANMVALCKNYEDGIAALDEGDDYALQIPLSTEKVMNCCKYLEDNMNRKGGIS